MRKYTAAQRVRCTGRDASDCDVLGAEVSALQFKDDGLVLGAGLSTGQVLLFDLRSPNPLVIKDHQSVPP